MWSKSFSLDGANHTRPGAGLHTAHDLVGALFLDAQLDSGVCLGKLGNQVAEKAGPGHRRKTQENLPFVDVPLNLAVSERASYSLITCTAFS